jgi:hypothetical protein
MLCNKWVEPAEFFEVACKWNRVQTGIDIFRSTHHLRQLSPVYAKKRSDGDGA